MIKKLTIDNIHSQKQKSNNNDQDLHVIEYSYRAQLYLLEIHDDYLEQFLLHSKSLFSKQISVSVHYNALQRVINQFTRDQTRINSAQIKHFFVPGRHQLSKEFRDYFPNLKT